MLKISCNILNHAGVEVQMPLSGIQERRKAEQGPCYKDW